MESGRADNPAADVLVIGAGPAGATAARTLAAAGLSTLLLDRAEFPRHKPCGGALSARVLGRFPYLAPALGRITTHWISRLHLEGPGGTSVDLTSETPAALMIRRVEFDALLVELARESGARVVTGAEVVEGEHRENGVMVATRDGRRFSARYLIACDGVHRVTARRLGIVGPWAREALAIDMMEETPNASLRAQDPGCLWVQYGCPVDAAAGGALWEGYGYVFPKRDHVNVGIGYLLSAYREAAPGPAYASHRRFVSRLKDAGILAGDSRRERFTPFLIPVHGPGGVVGRGRVLLAGDAAGFVHGLTAEGIYYAMVSGDLAARAVACGLGDAKGRRVVADYTRAWRAEVGQELRDSVLLQRFLFRSRDRVAAAIGGAAPHGALTAATIRYLSGFESYRRVRSLALSRNPGMVLPLTAEAIGRLWRSLTRAALL